MDVTANNQEAQAVKDKGRYGDTEMAHVTTGEIVLPTSVQTPEVINAVKAEFDRQGVPMERYVVGDSSNSENPHTENKEYFWSEIVDFAANNADKIIPAAVNIGSKFIGGGGQSSGQQASSSSTMPQTANTSVTAPVQTAMASPHQIQQASINYSNLPTTASPEVQTQQPQTSYTPLPIDPNKMMLPTIGGYINPKTNLQEFADPWSRENNQNLLNRVFGTGSVIAGEGRGEQALADATKQQRDQYTNLRRGYEGQGGYSTMYSRGEVRPTRVSGAGINVADNQQLKREAGYTGSFDNKADFENWAYQNPDNFNNYLTAGSQYQNFRNPVGYNPMRNVSTVRQNDPMKDTGENASLSSASTMSPVRQPRFQSRSHGGGFAKNF